MIDRRTLLQAAMVFIVAATVFLSSPIYIFTDSNFALLLGHNVLRHGHVRLDDYLKQPIDSPSGLKDERYIEAFLTVPERWQQVNIAAQPTGRT